MGLLSTARRAAFLASLLHFAEPASAQTWFTTGQDADLVLSAVDFNKAGGPLLFNHPTGIATDGTRLLLCDRFNNRVVVWNTLPTSWDSAPSLVLGQPDMTSNDPGAAKSQLNWPGNVSVGANGVTAVADTENDRILVWSNFPVQSAQPASVSLSLPVYTLLGGNRLEWPWGVWTDGTRLAAVATHGGAILFWNAIPTTDNVAPSYRVTPSNFGTPRNISTDGATYFFVGDHNAKNQVSQHGTFFWNRFPSAANEAPDFFFDDWIKGTNTSGGGLVAGGLSSIYYWSSMPNDSGDAPSVEIIDDRYENGDGPDAVQAGGRTWVVNYNGNNVLVYEGTPDGANDVPLFALGSPSIDHNTLDDIPYLQNPVLATDGTHLLATSDFDRRLWVWKTLPTSSGTAPDAIVSLATDMLSPWDNALQGNKFIAVGRRDLAIWETLPLQGQGPSRIMRDKVGTAVFADLGGAALDERYCYVSDRGGTIWVWEGIPSNGNQNPLRTIASPTGQLGRLSCDGTYLVATSTEAQASIYIYLVSDITAGGDIQPHKTITSSQNLRLQLLNEAMALDGGGFAIANTNLNSVLLWEDIEEAGNPETAVILGQADLQSFDPAIGRSRLFMPSSLASHGNRLWVGEFKFSSRIVMFQRGEEEIAGNSFQLY